MLSLLYVASVAAFQQFDWVSLLCMCLHIYIGDKQVFFLYSLWKPSALTWFSSLSLCTPSHASQTAFSSSMLGRFLFKQVKTLHLITMVTCQWDFSVHKLSSTCSNWMSSHGKSIGDLFLNILHVKCCS